MTTDACMKCGALEPKAQCVGEVVLWLCDRCGHDVVVPTDVRVECRGMEWCVMSPHGEIARAPLRSEAENIAQAVKVFSMRVCSTEQLLLAHEFNSR